MRRGAGEKTTDRLRELAGEQYDAMVEVGEADLAKTIAGVRCRLNLFRQQGSWSAAIRLLNEHVPELSELGLPKVVREFPGYSQGLVLITGETGSGKSTTLACVVDAVNRNRNAHIITIEDPIEYLHRNQKSIISQRELAMDTDSYVTALRASLRQAPDVILLGEMRDLDTIQTAMTAAETGHLVISTLHTVGAVNTIDRIIDVFPPNQQQQIRIQLAQVLKTVISQQLLPTISGGLVPAFEIMYATPAIRNLIREEKTHQIDSVIASSSRAGMRTMDQSLHRLVKEGTVSKDVALQHAIHQEALKKRFESEGL